ncbi:cellulase family glycosylhydrolase, partial [uncultured Fibrobacter sp.]|uniref:cellulase family glycosylhydrolase n=1 Tax=uncultured Fibrobacter sp. TaxID=261512 RepID=UPI00260CF8A5
MKKLFSAKFLGLGILAMGLVSVSFGRVGPVSQYGQLQAGKNSSGKGQIYGSCKGVTSGNEVAVQGMSLFWSISSDVGSPFWTADIVSGLVQKQNIQIIRAPMGVDEDWGSGNYFTKEGYYQGLMNTVVQAAIDNDIYVIIDYHSHKASDNVDNAKKFFGYMAQKWGKYDNVIFEVFNEPTSQSWGTIKTYAEAVVSTIRQYSDNLILVGNRSWDQYPSDAIGSEVSDSKKNIAYTFHFYAGTHSTGNEGANAVRAMNSGLSVFVSEWGTVNADGDGGVSGYASTWINWMKDHKLSGANWAVSNKNEGASYFSGSAWNYSNSGQWVNTNVFGSLPKSYTACSGSTPSSSSSVASSSSFVQPAGTTDYIDDLEDGDNFAFTGGEWYAYTDEGDNGASTITNGPGNKGGYNVVIPGSTAGSSTKYTAGITGVKLSQGGNKYNPYVALSVALNATQTAYDLSACSEITYKYKGAAHNFKAEDTAVQDYGYHQITKTAASSWTTVTIPWDMLTQESWADNVSLSKKRINKFTWEIKGTQPSMNYLYVDDVRCSGMAIRPVASPSSSSSSSARSSSSSVNSSSSVASSSSVMSSSSMATVVVTGDLKQTVQQGGVFQPVIFTNVNKGYRQTQNAYFLNISLSGTTLVVDGTVPANTNAGKYVENIYVNGDIYEIEVTVTETQSSSSVASSSSENSSSSVVVSDKWEGNAQITNDSNEGVTIGASNDWISDRVIRKNLGEITSGETYTLSFVATLQQNTMDMAVSLGEYCNESVALSATAGDSKFSCVLTARKDESAILTLTLPGSRWESVTIANLSLEKGADSSVVSQTIAIEHVSGSLNQTVVAGNEIEPVVFSYENIRHISVEGLPKGLKKNLDTLAGTYTILGAIPDTLNDKEYGYTVTFTGIEDSVVTAAGTITVKHKPVATTVVLSSGNETQTVTAGDSIVPIVFSYENLKSARVLGLPEGDLTVSQDKSAKTLTVAGAVNEALRDGEYQVKVVVEGLDNGDTAFAKIVVKHKPVVTTIALTSGNATQTVTAGEVIEPLVFTYANMKSIEMSGAPEGLTMAKDDTLGTVTVEGTVDASLTDGEYTVMLVAVGADNKDTAFAKIVVKHAPLVTVFELESENADRTVTAGDTILPIVYRYENVTTIEASGLPAGLKASMDKNAKLFKIFGTVDVDAVAQEYVFTIEVTGIDSNTSTTGKIVVEQSSSSEQSSASESSDSQSSDSQSSASESSDSQSSDSQSSASESSDSQSSDSQSS